jgi:hypothetical protein
MDLYVVGATALASWKFQSVKWIKRATICNLHTGLNSQTGETILSQIFNMHLLHPMFQHFYCVMTLVDCHKDFYHSTYIHTLMLPSRKSHALLSYEQQLWTHNSRHVYIAVATSCKSEYMLHNLFKLMNNYFEWKSCSCECTSLYPPNQVPEGSVILNCPSVPWYLSSTKTLFLHCLLVANWNCGQPLLDELWYVQICGISFLGVFTSNMPYAVSVSFLFHEWFNYENLVLNCTSQCKRSRIQTLKQGIWANRAFSYNHKDHNMFTDCVYESLSHQHVMQCYAMLQCFLLNRTSWIIELTYIRVT